MNMKDIIEADRFRYFGTKNPSMRQMFGGEGLQLRYLNAFRRAQDATGLANKWWRFRLSRLSRKTLIQIPWCCRIGPGFYIGHMGRVIVNPRAKIGANGNIATGVTIGAVSCGRLEGAPTIGDEVWIGTNAVVVGDITIGDDVVIAPGAYVNFDVPSHSVVIGNPGIVHAKANATEGMIQNKVDKREWR